MGLFIFKFSNDPDNNNNRNMNPATRVDVEELTEEQILSLQVSTDILLNRLYC